MKMIRGGRYTSQAFCIQLFIIVVADYCPECSCHFYTCTTISHSNVIAVTPSNRSLAPNVPCSHAEYSRLKTRSLICGPTYTTQAGLPTHHPPANTAHTAYTPHTAHTAQTAQPILFCAYSGHRACKHGTPNIALVPLLFFPRSFPKMSFP